MQKVHSQKMTSKSRLIDIIVLYFFSKVEKYWVKVTSRKYHQPSFSKYLLKVVANFKNFKKRNYKIINLIKNIETFIEHICDKWYALLKKHCGETPKIISKLLTWFSKHQNLKINCNVTVLINLFSYDKLNILYLHSFSSLQWT